MIRIFYIIIFYSVILYSQDHQQHKEKADTAQQHKPEIKQIEHQEREMQHAQFSRQGSGTAWLPDTSPMYGYMLNTDTWNFMFHGNLFIRYNYQDINNAGTRGDKSFDAPNWFMFMARNELSSSDKLKFSFMFSFDPLSVGGSGYPLLYQTGESYRGNPLIDRQHPHDLFSELSIEYKKLFSKELEVILYFGYPGEPALGPVAFMHRPSALSLPDSPLGHHWQDATHISFGVATAGIRIHNYKIEGSVFTGREPNEERYGFDKPRFDSYSFRLAAIPVKEISLQVSHAFQESPEELSPDVDVRKTTASILHSKMISENYYITSAAIWGLNYVDAHHKEHSFTFESDFNMHNTSFYTRYEWIQKSSEELLLQDLFDEDKIFKINSFTAGASYTFLKAAHSDFKIGAHGIIYFSPSELESIYGKNPVSLEIYLRITPGLMMHKR